MIHGELCDWQWRGYSTDEAEQVLLRTVQLACAARDSFWERHTEASTKRARRRPLVAASVGCYGASLADGSEYRGEYGLTIEELKTWHAPRFKLLAKVGHGHQVIQFRITVDLLPVPFRRFCRLGRIYWRSRHCHVRLKSGLSWLCWRRMQNYGACRAGCPWPAGTANSSTGRLDVNSLGE